MKINEVEIEILKKAIGESRSRREVLRKIVGSDGNGNNLKLLNRIAVQNGIDMSHLGVSRPESHKSQFFRIPEVIQDCSSFKDVGVKIGIAFEGASMPSATYKALRDYVQKKNLDFSHFDSFFAKEASGMIRYSDEEIFRKDSWVSSQSLKKRYLKKRGSDIFCDFCKISEWRGQDLTLQLDHCDGDSSNNLWENLRLLCPNCHSQTETFCGKNRKDSGIAMRAAKKASKRTEALSAREESRVLAKEAFNIERKMRVLGSGIDLGSLGRTRMVGELLGISPQKAGQWLKIHMPDEYALVSRQK